MKLNCNLKNCYGIEILEHEFDFFDNKTFLIYASNGVMKTSFAKTFGQLQEDKQPKEEVFNKKSECTITIDGVNIQKNEIFVIKPYIPEYKNENVVTLLVNDKSKKKYNDAHKEILDLKNSLLKKLSKKLGKKWNEVEDLMLKDFAYEGKLFSFLSEKENIDNIETYYNEIKYSDIFDDKVISFLKTEVVRDNISEYLKEYSELLEEVTFFGKDAFNPSRADSVLKSLENNKFFSKDNKVQLEGDNSLLSKDELQKRFNAAKKNLIKNKKLKEIQDLITKNATVASFQRLIENKPEIINELANLGLLKQKLWQSYFAEYKVDIKDLLSVYKEKQNILRDIENKASLDSTKWKEVVEIFNQRFEFPFEVDIKNSKSAILGQDTPNIVFKFKDEKGNYREIINRNELERILSQGEKRALYLLNIIFEIESRKENNSKTLFIIDDIANSFDYRNKYAIIEYLKELPSKAPNRFYQIILTHNFDFFRTVQERILTEPYKRTHSLIAHKLENKKIQLTKAGEKDITNPFQKWKNNIDQTKFQIAMIPFARELIDHLQGRNDNLKIFKDRLLSLLHVKDGTQKITMKNLSEIYKEVFGLNIVESNKKVFDLIISTATEILNAKAESAINLENKIILSIASRLKAEYCMKFCDITLENTIGETFEKYKERYSLDNSKKEDIMILEKVVIMTPENIHLNSFMYEPILDMSDWHLKELYNNISNLYKKSHPSSVH